MVGRKYWFTDVARIEVAVRYFLRLYPPISIMITIVEEVGGNKSVIGRGWGRSRVNLYGFCLWTVTYLSDGITC